MTKSVAPPPPRRQPPRPPRRAAKATPKPLPSASRGPLSVKPAAPSAPPASSQPPPAPVRNASQRPAAPVRTTSQPPAAPVRTASQAPAAPVRAAVPSIPPPLRRRDKAASAPASVVAPASVAPASVAPAAVAPAAVASTPFDARATVARAPKAKRGATQLTALVTPAAAAAAPVSVAPPAAAAPASVAPAAARASQAPSASAPPSARIAAAPVSIPPASRLPAELSRSARADMRRNSRELRPGDVIAERYRVNSIVSRARGLLLDASHTGFDQRVMVRVLTRTMVDDKAVEQFNREARILSRLESEHVARIVDFGRLPDGALYLAREHVRGESLASHAASKGGLSLEQAVLYLLQVAEAVQEAHTQGVVLRDLQPGHVFLAEKRNGAPIAKLTDFGTCKVVKDASAGGELSCTRLLGLSSSASPELVRQSKTISERADVWSLGCLLYELLTGSAPFQGEGVHLALAITRDEPAPMSQLRPDLPARLDQVMSWALAKDPGQRFRSVYAFAHELRRFACRRGRLLIEEIGRLATGCDVAPLDDRAEDDGMTMVKAISAEQRSALAQPMRLLAPLPAVRPPAISLPPAELQQPQASATQTSVPAASPPANAHPSIHPAVQLPTPSQYPAAAEQPSTRPTGHSVQPWMIEAPARMAKPGRLAWLAALPAAALVALAVSFSAAAPAAASADSGGLHAAATAATAVDLSDYQAPELPADAASEPAPAEQAAAPAEEAPAEEAPADAKAKESRKAASARASRSNGSRGQRRVGRRGSQFLSKLAPRGRSARSQGSVGSTGGGGRGTLVAMAVGSSCRFSVDGASRGTSSSIRISVPAGQHTVTCTQASGTSRNRSLRVEPGKAAVAVFKF